MIECDHCHGGYFMSKRYLTDRQLLERFGGRSRMWLFAKRKNDPRFPKARKFGGGCINFTAEDELEVWEAQAAKSATSPV